MTRYWVKSVNLRTRPWVTDGTEPLNTCHELIPVAEVERVLTELREELERTRAQLATAQAKYENYENERFIRIEDHE